ncbi:flagellin lysine-N-methylase [uncultured Clostridium sp.]|uniref:flagellin lysine-N-methylase n=1 Tax=uncultured Clostridium sp. TaxID=59620 RepID=UPI0025DC0E73|nr:flagellin lysine-N-methylase [uncultured Clostridium sp.]
MKTRVPDYFKKFKCIASECEDTCCAGWEIVVDEDAYEVYNSVKGEFGERLKKEIYLDEDNEHVFRLKGNNCAFLNKNKMCDIYSELGEENLCYTCQQYPRFSDEFGSIREEGLSLSCPEAARIIFGDSKITEFEVNENEEMVLSYSGLNFDAFVQLLKSRKIIMKILQNRNINLNYRMAIVLGFSKEIQDKIDEDKIREIEQVREKYDDNEFINKYIADLEKFKDRGETKYNNIKKYFNVYSQIEHINEECPIVIDEAIECFYKENSNYEFYIEKHKEFDEYYRDRLYEFEHIMVYFIFRYFMKGVYDYDVSAKVKLAIVSTLMIKELDVVRWIKNGKEFTMNDQVEIAKLYSKDIEHSEENVEALYETFEQDEIFNLDNLKTILIN